MLHIALLFCEKIAVLFFLRLHCPSCVGRRRHCSSLFTCVPGRCYWVTRLPSTSSFVYCLLHICAHKVYYIAIVTAHCDEFWALWSTKFWTQFVTSACLLYWNSQSKQPAKSVKWENTVHIPQQMTNSRTQFLLQRLDWLFDFDIIADRVPSVLWRCWLGARKGIRPVKKHDWWGAGMVICLERRADLHMAQLMPMPLTVSCFSKIQIGFTFLVPAHPGSPGQRAVKRVWVCVLTVWFIGATTAEKAEWIYLTWGGYWSPLFFSFIHSPSPAIASPMFHPFPSLVFFSSLKLSKEVWGTLYSNFPTVPSDKITATCRSCRGPNTLGPHDLQVGGDASYRSHRVVTPMVWLQLIMRLRFVILMTNTRRVKCCIIIITIIII